MTRSDEGGGRAPKFGNRLARIAIADPDRVRRVFWYQPADQRLACALVCVLRQAVVHSDSVVNVQVGIRGHAK